MMSEKTGPKVSPCPQQQGQNHWIKVKQKVQELILQKKI
jgi:hypothetical protein